jgi:Ras-related protein Rab-1A
MEYDYLYKFIILGDNNCGKTSLLGRYTDDIVQTEEYYPTIGVDFKIKAVESNGKNIKINIWDTAGQEKFKSIISYYYKNIAAAILVFDVTNRESFENIQSWIDEIKLNCELSDKIPMVLIGNKNDKISKRVVSVSEANVFADKLNVDYFETNMYNWDGINDAFINLVDKTTEHYIINNIPSQGVKNYSINIQNNEDKNSRVTDCCKIS